MAQSPTMNQAPQTNTYNSAMMVCYRECLSNMEKFTGNEEKKALQFVHNIERIGKMIEANDNILHCMCTAKLDGEAKQWYENNTSLTEWRPLKEALLERFTQPDSATRIFEQLKERKQKPDETIASYFDDVLKLCREYDSTMSQKMKISWLENGIKDSLKTPIKRQMKLLPEGERTVQAFLKIAKDEQELQDSTGESEATAAYAPYFTNTVSTTMPLTNRHEAVTQQTSEPAKKTVYARDRPRRDAPGYSSANDYRRREPPQRRVDSWQFEHKANNDARHYSNKATRKFTPCIICRRENHRTIDCRQRQQNGCFKCGQPDHRIRDCPEVFY